MKLVAFKNFVPFFWSTLYLLTYLLTIYTVFIDTCPGSRF